MDDRTCTSFCGIDVSKNSFDFCILNENQDVLQRGKIEKGREKYDYFLSIINKMDKHQLLILMESTSIYHLTIFQRLIKQNFHVFIRAVVNDRVAHEHKGRNRSIPQ